MAIFDFLRRQKKPVSKKEEERGFSMSQMMQELGVRTDAIITTYDEEERPDKRGIDDYIAMQENDGTVRAITRMLSMPIQASQLRIIPGEKDKGERKFVEDVLMGPQRMGGMSTPIPFVVADMTRAIFEGFRVYEKVPQIIKYGEHKGKIGWRKIAIRDAKTVQIRSDETGGFMGVHQIAAFGTKTVDINIPAQKCVLFTFQKERHPYYGESILKTAYYHYDKKHKLYYLAHKKAEVDAIGVKVLKIGRNVTEAQKLAAEEAADSIGVNTRISLPEGFELEINRASGAGFDVLPLIEHHDAQMAMATLTQAMQLGTKQKYAYTYGKGFEMQGNFVNMMLSSVMNQIENTVNEWIIPELVDWNFGSASYPKLKFIPLQDDKLEFIMNTFGDIIKKDPTIVSQKYIGTMANRVAEVLGLEVKEDLEKSAINAFERGKKKEADKLGKPAPSTPKEVKENLTKKAVDMSDDPYVLEKFEAMGRTFAQENIK